MFAQSDATVRPRATIDGPYGQAKKAERMNMDPKHRFGTDYDIDAAVLGWRGSEKHGQARYLRVHNQLAVPVETAKKGKLGNTPAGSALGQ